MTTKPLLRIGEFKTLANITSNSADSQLLTLIEAESEFVTARCQRRFDPHVVTLRYTAAPTYRGGNVSSSNSRVLLLDYDVQKLINVTNGDSAQTAIALADVELDKTLRTLRLLGDSLTWQSDVADGKFIEVKAECGYGYRFENKGKTLSAALNNTATTFQSAGAFERGQLVKIDDEFLYITATNAPTYTVERGANGTTAAAHANGAAILEFEAHPSIKDYVKRGVQLRLSQTGAVVIGTNAAGDPILQSIGSARAALVQSLALEGLVDLKGFGGV
jgi:hypothetical protein